MESYWACFVILIVKKFMGKKIISTPRISDVYYSLSFFLAEILLHFESILTTDLHLRNRKVDLMLENWLI